MSKQDILRAELIGLEIRMRQALIAMEYWLAEAKDRTAHGSGWTCSYGAAIQDVEDKELKPLQCRYNAIIEELKAEQTP